MRDVREQYERDGFAVLPGVISEEALSKLETALCKLATELSGRQIDELHSEEFADVVGSNRELESALYSRVRDYPWLLDFSSEPKLTAAVQAIARSDIGLFRHIPLRIDLPKVTRELAVWHQDHFYVKGNTEVVTAWVPLQDTSFIKGCLQVMPGSHKLGPIPHDKAALGKKWYPSTVFDREIRYVEMKRGDALLFHACLLHSSNLNLSEEIRFSVNARYTPLHLPTDPAMGAVLEVSRANA